MLACQDMTLEPVKYQEDHAMDISLIYEYVILAETKKYSAAARRLNISQSTLSRHVQTLEAELNCTLFSRTTREVELSDYGKIFLNHAKNIVKEYDEARKLLKEHESLQNSQVRVGVVHHPDRYQVVDCILDFQTSHPEISLHITEGSLSDLRKEFLEERLNIITMTYADWEKLPARFIVAGKSRLAAILPKNHPLAASSGVLPLHALENAKIMVPEKTNYVYQYLEHILKQENIHPNIFYQGNTSGISDLLQTSMGILVQDYEQAALQLDDPLMLCELEPEISYTYGLEYRECLTKNEQIYVKFIKKKFDYSSAPGLRSR